MAGLSICCVNAQDYLGKGRLYVETLFDGVRRNLPQDQNYKFICFTDDSELYTEGIIKKPLPDFLRGWWNKIYLFKKGVFDEGERVVFLDLDTAVVGGLDYIVRYQGPFATLRDFWRPEGLGPAVILWTPTAETEQIWDIFYKRWLGGISDDYRSPLGGRGDQAILEDIRDMKTLPRFDYLQDLYPGSFKSFKTHCQFTIPKNTKVVCFHGEPRPHHVKEGWVPHIWKIGGGSVLELEQVGNTSDKTLENNIRHTCSLDLEHLADQYYFPTEKPLVIVGGGPSLADTLTDIRFLRQQGATIWALNNTYKYLRDNDITPNAHIMLDARQENIEFLPDNECLKLYASQCHPDVFAKAGKVVVWHSAVTGLETILGDKRVAIVAGGSSVGLKAMGLAQAFGFKNIHLFGYDSSYADDKNHAYPQPLNDGENIIDVTVNGRSFKCAAWMAAQTNEFKEVLNGYLENGMQFYVHGYGLLPYVSSLLSQ